MNIAKILNRYRLLLFSQIVFPSFLFLFLICPSNFCFAQSNNLSNKYLQIQKVQNEGGIVIGDMEYHLNPGWWQYAPSCLGYKWISFAQKFEPRKDYKASCDQQIHDYKTVVAPTLSKTKEFIVPQDGNIITFSEIRDEEGYEKEPLIYVTLQSSDGSKSYLGHSILNSASSSKTPKNYQVKKGDKVLLKIDARIRNAPGARNIFPVEAHIQIYLLGANGEEIDVTPVKFDEPKPGQIMDDINEPTLPPDKPITGILGEVKNDPNYGKLFHARKVMGDVYIDHGEFGKKPIKPWDIVRVGDTIVTGANSKISLINPVYPGQLYIEQNSRVTIIEKKRIVSLSQRWQSFKKISWLMLQNFQLDRPIICIEEGTALMPGLPGIILGIMIYLDKDYSYLDEEEIRTGPPLMNYGSPSFVFTRDRGTIYRLSYDKSTGVKSVSVIEGEVEAICALQPEIVWSVKAGEKLSVDKDCGGEKSNLTKSEIQQITSLFPDVKETTSRTPVADSRVYAYAYRNWDKANWGAYNIFTAGWHPTGGESRAYLKFDLSGVDPKSVAKATLKLFHNHTGGNNSLSVGIHAVTGTWQEGGGTYHSGQIEKPASPGEISWVNQPSFDPSPVAQFNPGGGVAKWVEVDITPLVKAWLSGKPNFGLVITSMGPLGPGTGESVYGFYSREFEDAEKRPVLVLSGSGSVEKPVGDIPFGTADFNEFSMKGNIYYLPANTSRLPEFGSMSPVGSVYTKELNISNRSFTSGFPGVTNRFEWFGIRYTGTFQIEQGGQYSFRLASDDGSKLWIDNQLIINNDGIHPYGFKSGIIHLNPGKHHIQVDYFQGPRAMVALQLFVTEPGGIEKIFSPEYSSNQTSGGIVGGSVTLPVFEDFSSGSGNWQLDGQDIALTDGKLYWNTGNHLFGILNKPIPMENVVIEFDGYTETNGINVYLHNDDNEGYIVISGGWFNTKSGSDVGKSGQNRELVNSKVWEAKRWHHYKIVRNGDILQTFCDGRKIYERTVTSRFSGTGYLKFNSYATRIGIDNVKVTDASGSVQQTGGGSGIAGDGK